MAGMARWWRWRPTPTGNVTAVQQIYVTDDGGKAPVTVQKRTNKARDDWSDISAVRLPGTPADHPLRRRRERLVGLAGDRPGDLGLPRHC